MVVKTCEEYTDTRGGEEGGRKAGMKGGGGEGCREEDKEVRHGWQRL